MKTFLSIGSGPGMGMATAERFATEGYRVVLTSRDEAGLADRAAGLRAKGYSVEVASVDAADLASVKALIRQTQEKFGDIDVLHVNSASMRAASIETQPADTFVPDLVTNIGAALVATQEAANGMLARGEGTILITGGGLAVSPHPDYLSLSIGKAGQRAMVLALFEPFRGKGVHIATVTVAAQVAPGSDNAHAIADLFWGLHAEDKNSWSAEATYTA